MEQTKDRSEVWIVNTHGVKSSKEAWMAKDLLKSNPAWEYCDPDPVSKEKVYPVGGGMLTENGKSRRTAATETTVVEEVVNTEEPSMKEIRDMAKEQGINSFGKTKSALMEELNIA